MIELYIDQCKINCIHQESEVQSSMKAEKIVLQDRSPFQGFRYVGLAKAPSLKPQSLAGA